jgi:hypothetical protein
MTPCRMVSVLEAAAQMPSASFRAEHGDKPVARVGRAHVKDIIGAKADKPEAANNLLKVLRVMLNYAVSVDMLPSGVVAVLLHCKNAHFLRNRQDEH